ncbi:MAG TPA: serine protease [Candidatus Acidoferrales bacterium]
MSTFSFGRISKDQANRDFFEVIGTGILVATDTHTPYIVTAKHVFYQPMKNWHPTELRIRFGWQEQKTVYDELGLNILLRGKDGTDLWKAAADGSDLAALAAPPLSQLGPSPHAISVADIAGSDDMFEGATIIVLGYPGIVGNEYLVRAISRTGMVSWLNPANPTGKPFLIDANIYPGNSGGPVIKVPTGLNKKGTFAVGGRVVLLGIVSQAPSFEQQISLQVPGVLNPITLKQSIPLGGTGIIEPASGIPALLQLVNAGGAPAQQP